MGTGADEPAIDPCPPGGACQLGLARCGGNRNRRLCTLIAAGRREYAAVAEATPADGPRPPLPKPRPIAAPAPAVMPNPPPEIPARPVFGPLPSYSAPRAMPPYSGPRPGSVAVLVPTCCRPDFVGRALASVRAQTRADFECIVCLNGRYDREGYAEALAPFLADSRFRAVEISAAGIGEACQAGLEATDAEYLAILDDDDEYLPEYLARLTGLLDADPTLAVAFGTVAEYRGGERVYQTRHLDPYGRPATGWSHADMWARNWIPCIGGVFRGEILRAGGGFDPSAGGNTDMDVWLRCTSVGGAVELPEVLAVRHLHGSNTSGDYNRQGDPRMVDWHNRIREKQRAGCYWRWSGDRPDDEPLPSLPRMAANLAGAALDHMLNGLKMADEATRKSRLAICRQCPHYRGDGRCSLCGCGLDAKVSWAASRCPDYPPRW